MEIDNNKKTKASQTGNEEEIDTTTVKKPRLEDGEKTTAPLLEMTEEDIKQSLIDWFDACDPLLRTQTYGWGGRSVIGSYIDNKDKIKSCASFYQADKDSSIFESDKALCEGICNLHILHIAAKEWSDRPSICYGSYEQQVLFFVIKHNLLLKKESAITEKFVHRLMYLSHAYTHDLYYKYNSTKTQVEIVKKQGSPMKEVPLSQQASFAVFFYPNLQFLWKHEGSEKYSLACENIKNGVDSFAEILQQISSLIRTDCVAFDPTHVVAAKDALNHAVKKYENFLLDKNYDLNHRLEFNKKPLSLKMVFQVQY